MAATTEKKQPQKRETALGSALKSAIAKNGGEIATVKTKDAKPAKAAPKVQKPSRASLPRPEEKRIARVAKEVTQLAPDAQAAVMSATKKIAKKIAAKKPARAQVNGKPESKDPNPTLSVEQLAAEIKAGQPYSPAVLKAYKEQLTHKLRAIIKEADLAGLLVHIPIVNGRPFVKFHNKATYKPKQPAPQQQAA